MGYLIGLTYKNFEKKWTNIAGVDRTKDVQLKGEVLLVGAISRISKTIPVKAIGNTQIPINLWSKNLKWSSPLKTIPKEVNWA